MKSTCCRRYERKGRVCRDCPVPARLARLQGRGLCPPRTTHVLLSRYLGQKTAFQLIQLKRMVKIALRRRYRRYGRFS